MRDVDEQLLQRDVELALRAAAACPKQRATASTARQTAAISTASMAIWAHTDPNDSSTLANSPASTPFTFSS